ncbi:flagellar biosynthesis protein FlhB [Pseudorhodobacter sp.]|uniref:EscU/YscU/HrcU family type III secretion system export apparatus switch protein n=1 Tax=Pseudorhodobacter sp. TaxID=1934400 RepID=UPI00264A22B6|nr:flagellar type III secretion system protein FlhB [Pseudorhodobacter sp.]MDN5788067.1 flagellar type III secretion system protein FlhB [Pseudorhodobacter sp.]
MSEDEPSSEKEHEPSQKKLDDARKKGEFPRSADLITAASYAGFLLAAVAVGAQSMINAGGILTTILARADKIGPTMPFGAGIGLAFATAVSPFFLLPMIAAALMVVAQRAMVFSATKLAPKLNRISPISGAKNKFGRKGLFEFFKSFLKLTVISTLLFGFLSYRAEDFLRMVYLSPAPATGLLMRHIVSFLTLIVLVALSIGILDYFWQRAEHLRSNRMSRKEMMDEHKDSDGDPHMKASRRQRAQEIASNRMLSDVAKADVVIVNPTHFAVALQWDRSTGRAPICIAKGTDEIASRIRERAAVAGVPLHSDPPTARLLHASLEVGQEIHPDHYRAVAASIRFAEMMRKRMPR